MLHFLEVTSVAVLYLKILTVHIAVHENKWQRFRSLISTPLDNQVDSANATL